MVLSKYDVKYDYGGPFPVIDDSAFRIKMPYVSMYIISPATGRDPRDFEV